jgi:3'(2'), 5'-bisphosphate nucleotidase
VLSEQTLRILTHLPAVANIVRRVALEAGAEIMNHYSPVGYQGEVMTKPDGSSVTAADYAADVIIWDGLQAAFPGVPIVSEERTDKIDFAAIEQSPYYWLVDPLDATKRFRTGHPDFCINIALMHHDQPIMGVVYGPALQEGFVGYLGETPGAIRWHDERDTEHDLTVREIPRDGLTVLTSSSHAATPVFQSMLDQIKLAKRIQKGGALKFCDIAAGRADLYVRFRGNSYWDTAAGAAILRAAGGHVLGLDGKDLTYSRDRKTFEHTGLIACADPDYILPVIEEIRPLIHIAQTAIG